jgi:hypothetical protein
MQVLAKNIKEEVDIDLYLKHLQKSRIIKENFSIKTIKKLCCYVREERYAPD